MATMDASFLPMIKCSSCGSDVEISAMGDHICPASASDLPTALAPSRVFSPPPEPEPEPPLRLQQPARSLSRRDPTSPRSARPGPPPRIDPSIANQPFLRPGMATPGREDGRRPRSPAPRSPYGPLQRSQTTPLPTQPPSPKLANLDCAFPPFPTARARSASRSGRASPRPPSPPPPAPPPLTRSMTDMWQNSSPSWQNNIAPPENLRPAPSLVAGSSGAGPFPNATGPHQRQMSTESTSSSYRTSLASTHNGESISRPSTSHSMRRPSLANIPRPRGLVVDAPPLPPAPLQAGLRSSTNSQQSAHSHGSSEQAGAPRNYSGFDFGVSGDDRFPSRNSENLSGPPSDCQPARELSQLFSELSTQQRPSSTRHSGLTDGSGQRPASTREQYLPFNPSATLRPDGSISSSEVTERRRKNSDASSISGLSVSNFARALGLSALDETGNSSTSSSDSSPSETRSGSSMSSFQSSNSAFGRRKPSDVSRESPSTRLEPIDQEPPMLDGTNRTESPAALEPPPIPAALLSPDSPTDPAIGKQGSLSLRADGAGTSPSARPSMTRSATAPVPGRAMTPKPKGPCRGCGDMIMGKSVSSADGRLTGRYHKSCFVCHQCRAPFQTADFYVLEDRPYCTQHYHERNGSLCSTCNTGIEGQYLEVNERTVRGGSGRQKFHPECLRCTTCRIVLNGEYFEWNGLVYCERDARRAAYTPPPNARRRPTLPSSPLGQSPVYPPRYPPGAPGMRPGPGPGPGPGPRLGPGPGPSSGGLRPDGPYGPPSPGGGRRFPERRTTRLMMN